MARLNLPGSRASSWSGALTVGWIHPSVLSGEDDFQRKGAGYEFEEVVEHRRLHHIELGAGNCAAADQLLAGRNDAHVRTRPAIVLNGDGGLGRDLRERVR